MGRLYYSTSDSTTNGTSITPPEKLQCVYIVASHPFPEVDEFVETSSAEYGLEVARYVLPMKKGLEIYLEERASIKAVFFIRHLSIEYCPLYDRGYTSLGGKKDTHPNPHLKKQDNDGETFRPAYELTEDDEERLGRDF
ncbi:hypothetical protein ACHAQI_011022 [Fusarium lateritium]